MKASRPQVVLIGNYLPDRQQSMRRFAESLERHLLEAGVATETWLPPAVLAARVNSTTHGAGKWLGYVDKFVLFPMVILQRRLFRRRGLSGAIFHVCDHSNAPYLRWLPRVRTVITTHDVLAIRGALGHADAYCPASATGKILQRWILTHLLRARWLTADSSTTLAQLEELESRKSKGHKVDRRIIHLAFNAEFNAVPVQDRARLLRESGVDPETPFLLHVGSALPRKNRRLLVDLVTDATYPWSGQLVFAGAAVDSDLASYATSAGISGRIISVVGPDHEHLRGLYSGCHALVFPSLSEGFGWPVIEAQASGAPVVASSIMPMPEVGGKSVIYADPHDSADFARAVHLVTEPAAAEAARRGGLENCRRFDPSEVLPQFRSVYEAMRSVT